MCYRANHSLKMKVYPYGNDYIVATLLQPCKVVARLSQGCGKLCKVFTTLQDGCVVVVEIIVKIDLHVNKVPDKHL